MAKDKRKSKPSKAPAAKNKAKTIKVLNKKKAVARALARKAPLRAKKPAQKKLAQKKTAKPASAKKAVTVVAKKPAAPLSKAAAAKAAALAKAAQAKPEEKAGKKIKSTKAALEQIEARLAEGFKGKGKGGRPGRRGKRDEWIIGPAPTPEDAETRRTRLKNLIKLGKDRGFLTYSEINDHLPDDLVDAEQIEAIISTFGDMGIQVYDQAPDQESLLINEQAPVASSDEDVEEQAEAALSTVDSEFGRTTDPVRMCGVGVVLELAEQTVVIAVDALGQIALREGAQDAGDIVHATL